MIYADYDYYIKDYGGRTIRSEEFQRFVAEASIFIDKITAGKAAENPDSDQLKICCCSLCDILAATADTGGLVKQSESVGSWSYTLAGSTDGNAENLMYRRCLMWLPDEWLYSGVARE